MSRQGARDPILDNKPKTKKWLQEHPRADRLFKEVVGLLLGNYHGKNHGYVDIPQYRFNDKSTGYVIVKVQVSKVIVRILLANEKPHDFPVRHDSREKDIATLLAFLKQKSLAGFIWDSVPTSVGSPTSLAGSLGFADAETRKEIETAAVRFAQLQFEAQGYRVHDHQRDNLGYDLLAVKGNNALMLEVKGTDSEHPRFFLTRNERRCASTQNEWRLVLVIKARRDPTLATMTFDEVNAKFDLDALAWECTPRSTT